MVVSGQIVLAWSLTSLAVSQRPVSSGDFQPERLTVGLNASSGGRASLLSVHTCSRFTPPSQGGSCRRLATRGFQFYTVSAQMP